MKGAAEFFQDDNGDWYYQFERDASNIPGCAQWVDESPRFKTKSAAVKHAATIAHVPVSIMDMMP